MTRFVELQHKRQNVLMNIDQICSIEESDGSGELLVRCANAEDYVLQKGAAEKLLAALGRETIIE